MSLIDRAKNILLSPQTEWPKIDGETNTVGGLFTGYAMILAILPAIGSVISSVAISGALGVPGLGMGFVLVSAVVSYVISLGVMYLMGIIANALSPSFDGQKDQLAAMKTVVYSGTPIWVAGLLSWIPILGWLLALAAFGYAGYQIYLGSQATSKVPQDKAVGFTIVLILIWIVTYIVISGIITAMLIGSMFTGAMGAAALYG